MKVTNHRQGFTLVELAIVLVIIGLLVGGVLVGQDLIKAATVRSTVSDVEKTNAAATTFRTKYAGLPGDEEARRAAEYGLLSTYNTAGQIGRDGTAGKGDGNNMIEGCTAGATALGCETALFWVDLSTAALIAQRLATYDATATTVNSLASSSAIAAYLPKQKLRDSAFLHVFTSAGKNYFYLGSASQTSAAGVITSTPGVTGGEARSIDEKFDDAYPTSGIVTSVPLGVGTFGTVDTGATMTANTCMDGTKTPKVYNVVDANINTVNCGIQLRANF